ncbi:MAG: signal peptide peptidase SppA [Rhodospirillaceae bacterium TMED8]|nr:signal peptide peptidase SppA [Magnetovibrio sp.]OUT49919.1 MAG: signal peptide peptidase SppA [Rhodospirillaceae bacterium TMED8]|tara:strand:- start:3389 stop:4291 length:903 start_codon:yes stop_codon:yes gene_type:complete
MYRDIDSIIDRRRLKRRLNFWRIATVLALFVALGIGLNSTQPVNFGDYIGRMKINGIITADQETLQALAEVANAENAKALILSIDSPGGTVVGGEVLFKSLREVSAKKPVVAVMENTATSAAYMAALGADHIIAHAGTVTGSIGVLLQSADVTGLMENIGIKPEIIKSSPLKAQPNPMETLTSDAREMTQEVVRDLHSMFVDIVKARRGMDDIKARSLADGRIFSGRQALAVGLIDAVGHEKDALNWLEKNHAIKEGTEIRPILDSREGEIWREILSLAFGTTLFSDRLKLDGVISLWHP